MAKHWKKPESKQCKTCSAIFEKVGRMTDKYWEQTLNCPSCRSKKASKRDRKDHNWISHPGEYTVTHPVIDAFLYSKPGGN